MSIAEGFASALDIFPDWLIVVLISMLPFIELRGALPVAIIFLDMNWAFALVICVIANMIPVPFVLLFFSRVEKWARKYEYWNKKLDWLYERTRKKASKKIEKYKVLGLMIYVGIPLPVTGAWTGSLIAYLFDLDIKRSFLTILGGVIIAGILMLFVSIGLKNL